MSQAQPTIEKIHSLRKKQETALKSLTLIGYLEGTSFLLLLFIAMPLKYMLDIPEGVKYIGMAHGVLFIVYIVVLVGTAIKVKIPRWAIPAGVLGSLLPFGPFIFDHLLKKNLQKSVSKEA